MLEMYQCYTSKPTDTYGIEERSYTSRESYLASRPKLMQQYYRSAKVSSRAKRSHWTLRTCCLNWCQHVFHFSLFTFAVFNSCFNFFYEYINMNMSCFFIIIKTVSISCNWTDQLLFTYKMALCTSHSHSLVFGWSILIKFTYLTDINPIQSNPIYFVTQRK